MEDGVFPGLWLLLSSELLGPMSLVFTVSVSMFLNALPSHASPSTCNPFAVSKQEWRGKRIYATGLIHLSPVFLLNPHD